MCKRRGFRARVIGSRLDLVREKDTGSKWRHRRMYRVRWVVWKQAEEALRSRVCWTPLNTSHSTHDAGVLGMRFMCSSSQGEPPKDGEKPPRPKKMRRRTRYGSYDKSFEDELDMVPVEEGITHLYNTRGIVDKWLGHPTLESIFPDRDVYAKGESPNVDPPGEGPILRWDTRVVLGPGGDAWHPANRKVKVSVYLKELQLTPQAQERLILIVGKRYHPIKDELTITSERYDLREENRKDVLRTLYALIDEANTANLHMLAARGEFIPSNTDAAIAS